jgi:hypothetical protein
MKSDRKTGTIQHVRRFSMSVEPWKSFFDWGAVALVFATFIFGAGALITGNIINKRQEIRLRQFDKDLTESKTELAVQQERVEILRADNNRLENLIQPRSLKPEQQSNIGNALLPFKGSNVAVRIVAMNDPESYNFGQQIWAALKHAQLNTLFSQGTSNGLQFSAVSETGIGITWPSGQEKFAVALRDALSKTGHVKITSVREGDCSITGPTDFLKTAVCIWVNPKPFELIK